MENNFLHYKTLNFLEEKTKLEMQSYWLEIEDYINLEEILLEIKALKKRVRDLIVIK